MPAYAHLHGKGAASARLFADRIFTLLFAAQVVLLVVAWVFMPEVIAILAPGFKDESSPINPQRAAYEIDRAMPADGILVSDIGIHHNWLLQY